MTSLELTLNLPNRLAKDAAHAGLLSPKAIETLLRAEIRRRAAHAFLAVADRVAQAGIPPLTEAEIQRGVDAVRHARRARRAPGR